MVDTGRKKVLTETGQAQNTTSTEYGAIRPRGLDNDSNGHMFDRRTTILAGLAGARVRQNQ